ncbi:MAG: HEAT repeat domain-containing protein [Planctomycetaceae bacterium]
MTAFRQLLILIFAATACVPSAVAQRDLKDIPVPDPELEKATFVLPDGFEVNLFAADPIIAKPIQMNFDEAGRLWIVSSEVYPHIRPGDEATDRVVVVQDTNHDGVSDSTHVFAEGLLIPTGIAPGDGGAYVANSTELLHFADADNDLKADSKRIVLSGFGTEDTHHILHTLRWGPDGYLYFNQSIYIHSHIETPWGVRRLNAGGIWQFRPETLELGVFMRGLVNSWGHHFDRFGQSFATDGAGGEGINYVVPGAYYFTAADAPQILHGLNPGSPKHCGLEIVETPMLPADWQGSAITNDFRGHRVCRFTLAEDRSGFVSREQQEVIRSNHVAFRPIDVKLGPDGAIYIADWYNPIIQHGEVDFRDPRRDHTHGRIWRVTWKGAPQRTQINTPELTTAELFQLLSSPDNAQRQNAKQVLRQRGAEVLPELRKWVAAIPVSAQTEQLRLEALWCFQSLRAVERPLLESLLKAEDGRVRAAAVRVLSHWKAMIGPDSSQWFQQAVNDTHPRVRLEAVRSVAYSPNADSERERAIEQVTQTGADGNATEAVRAINELCYGADRIQIAIQATDHPTDTFLDYAIWLTARETASAWMPAFQAGTLNFGGNVNHLLAAFSAVDQGAPVDFLLSRLYADTSSTEQKQQVVQLVAASGNAQQISELVRSAVNQHDAGAFLSAVTATRGRGNLQVPLSAETLQAALTSDDLQLRSVALKAVGQWKLPAAAETLQQILVNDQENQDLQMAALEGFALMGGPPAISQLQQTADAAGTPLRLRRHAAALLTGLNPGRGAQSAVRLFSEMKLADHPEDLARSFMVVKNGDRLLADRLAGAKLDTDVAREILRIVREAGRAAPELEAALKTAGNITSRKDISAEERGSLLTMVQQSATAVEGEAVFRNEKLGCLKCHAIGGAGGLVGPDMVSLGGSAQPDYLLESLLNPNAKVKENYHTIVIATTEGKVLSGVQVKASDQEVVIRNGNNELVTVPRKDIEEIGQGLSLMPEGLVDVLTDRELTSLVRFLSELGRTPEFTISRRQLARTWDVMSATDAAAFQLRRTSYAMAATDDPAFTWVRAYSKVDGTLPVLELPTVSVKNRSAAGSRGVCFARCTLVAETAGDVVLHLNGVQGLELRVDEKPVDLTDQFSIIVTPGRHRFTFTIDQTLRSEPIELERLSGSAVATFGN